MAVSVNKKRTNTTFLILSVFAMCFVVAGHLDFDAFTLNGLFPYYSFHVPLFVFISGYFYKETSEDYPLLFLKKKLISLMVPYLIWNLIYGAVVTFLHTRGYLFGENLNLRTLFIEPFLSGHQFMLNFPGWFVPALFLVELIYLFSRKLLKIILFSATSSASTKKNMDTKKLFMEIFIIITALIVGVATVYLAKGGHVWGLYKFPGRLILMLFFYCFGFFYHTCLEKVDTLKNIPYFASILLIQITITLFCNGVNYSVVWVTGFANMPLIPFITGITGIMFWLRISRLLSPILEGSPVIELIGNHTYSIMLHHITILFIFNTIFCSLYARGIEAFADFDKDAYLLSVDYHYLPGANSSWQWILFFSCMLIPAFGGVLYSRLKSKFHLLLHR